MKTDPGLKSVERQVASRLLVELQGPFGLQQSPVSGGDQIHWTRSQKALPDMNCRKRRDVLYDISKAYSMRRNRFARRKEQLR